MVWSEHIPCFLCRALQDYYHESTHKECAVDHLISLVRSAVMEDTIVGVVLVA